VALADADAAEPRVVLQDLADELRDLDRETPFANRFFYRLRERLELLNPIGGAANPLTAEQAQALMVAEYLSSGVGAVQSPEQATAIIAPLLEQCRHYRREAVADEDYRIVARDHWSADGALLLRFLIDKGITL
jgi:hypothetical protein